jgi:hypothetical protein
MDRAAYLILASTQDKRSHHFLGSGDPLLRKHGNFGIALRLEDRAKGRHVLGELFGKDEVHQRLPICELHCNGELQIV